MAKKSQRRTVRYEKDKSGCMWGFISMFDFRHGHTTRKLIVDRRRSSKHSVGGAVHSKNKFEMLSDLDEVCHDSFDTGESKRQQVKSGANKHSVKKLIEEEMFIDQTEMKDIDNAQVESKESRLRINEVPAKADYKRKKKSSKKSRDMDADDLNLDETLKSNFSRSRHSRQQSKDNLDLDKIIEEFFHLKGACSTMRGSDGGVRAQSNENHAISENIAREVIREFLNQMILNGKDPAEARKFLRSHELMEALQFISSDEELFLTLLQNPNSILSKCIQEFGSSQGTHDKYYSSVTDSNFFEHDLGNMEQTRETVNHKKHNFFRKKGKSEPKNPTKENGKTEFSNRIVILKPGSMGLQNSETGNDLPSSRGSRDTSKNNGPSAKGSSHFSLTEIKKKLKNAMGRERHANPEGISKKYPAEYQKPGGKSPVKDNVGMRSPNKDHFFIEKIARPAISKGGKKGALKDSELLVEHESGSYPRRRVSPNLYIEAKKSLSEMVSSGDESMDLSNRPISKTLGRILSLPDYNFSPFGSPGRDWERHFATAQTKFSTPDKAREANEHNLSPKPATFAVNLDQETDNPEKRSSVCDESSNNIAQEIKSDPKFSDQFNHVDKEKDCCPFSDEIVTEVDVESVKEINILESSSESVGLSIEKEDRSYDILEIPESTECSQCSTLEVTEEIQQPSPLSPPSITNKTERLEKSISDACGRPSPVSVLDTPFVEDDVSPGCSKIQPVDLPVQPLHIQFEEQDSPPLNQVSGGKYCLEEDALIYKYIESVLKASGLTTDQFLVRRLSSDKILDPSLSKLEECLANRLCHDPKLLYDCVDEILAEVCRHYFVASPWVSVVNPGIRTIPNLEKVVVKVWEGVCWHFLPSAPPRTLDKIVRKDMEKTSAWMDLRFDAEAAGSEMGQVILAELVEDTILSCIGEKPEDYKAMFGSMDT